MSAYTKSMLLVVLALVTVGCAGTKTFHEVARAGDTVAIPAGWQHHFTKDDLTITLTPNAGTPVVYSAGQPVGVGDPTIRAITNMYVDPLSSMVVSRQTGQDLTPFAQDYANTTSNVFTGGDKDWWQTAIFIDLPATMPDTSAWPIGITTITISNSQGESVTVDLDIVPGAGTSHDFAAQFLAAGLDQDQLDSLGRVEHYTLNFSGPVVPAAVELDLVHDTDIGQAYVVNPLGYIKNAAWSDDGTYLKFILTPTRDGEVAVMQDLKFYVAGGITNLEFAAGGTTMLDVPAFDTNGEQILGVDVTID